MRRVQARQLLASILRCKPPLYARTSLVACPLPCAALPSQRLLVWDAPTEALTAQHRELDLHLVQPRAVLGRVVELQLGSDAPPHPLDRPHPGAQDLGYALVGEPLVGRE